MPPKTNNRQKRCHERVRHVTSSLPWRSKPVSKNIEMRLVPEKPDAGEYLISFRPPSKWNSYPKLLPEFHSQVWIGVREELVVAAKDVLSNWGAAHLGLLSETNGVKFELLVVIGPVMKFVTGETSEAFTMPHFNDERDCFEFLVCIELPQPLRSVEQEKDWLCSALTHELEHVWQFIALNDTLMEPHWLSLAEMSAVFAEVGAAKNTASYLDYGPDFLRCAPLGITGVGNISRLSPSPYWTFPFMEHLESTCQGIHREIWCRPGMRSGPSISDTNTAALTKGPWKALDAILNDNQTTLKNEWLNFCKTLIIPVPGSTAEAIARRFPPRLPSLRIELRVVPGEGNLEWECKTWPLSVHWIQVSVEAGSHWTLTWEASGFSNSADLVVLIKPYGMPWQELRGQTLEFKEGSTNWDVLLVDATVLDMSNLLGHELYLGTSDPNLRVTFTSACA